MRKKKAYALMAKSGEASIQEEGSPGKGYRGQP